MAIGSVEYGVAKEGETIGTSSWAQDTTIHSDKSDNDEKKDNPDKSDVDEKNSAGYLAASLGSFALALAVMNFWWSKVVISDASETYSYIIDCALTR